MRLRLPQISVQKVKGQSSLHRFGYAFDDRAAARGLEGRDALPRAANKPNPTCRSRTFGGAVSLKSPHSNPPQVSGWQRIIQVFRWIGDGWVGDLLGAAALFGAGYLFLLFAWVFQS